MRTWLSEPQNAKVDVRGPLPPEGCGGQPGFEGRKLEISRPLVLEGHVPRTTLWFNLAVTRSADDIGWNVPLAVWFSTLENRSTFGSSAAICTRRGPLEEDGGRAVAVGADV